MKTIKFISGLLLSVCLSFMAQQILAQSSETQQTGRSVSDFPGYVRPQSALEILTLDKDDFRKLSFEVDLNKNEFLLLEPIIVKFKISNLTTEQLQAYPPKFLNDVAIKARCNGKSFEIKSLTGVSDGSRDQTLIMPQTIIEETDILQPSGEGYFWQAGTCDVQFVLSNYGKSGGKLTSSIFKITIKEPSGKDKGAYEFLKRNQQEAASSVFTFRDQFSENISGQSLLETFVSNYGDSVYGDYATVNLGSVYKARGEMNKAKALFEKISSSSNSALAEKATRSLAEIRGKISHNGSN